MPGRTRGPVCKSKKHTSSSPQVRPDRSGFPRANGFNGFLRALPGDRALLSPSPRNAKHCRELTSASRGQDHTTSPSAKRCRSSFDTLRVHRIPRPTFVTIAKRPSSRSARRPKLVEVICPTAQAKSLGAGARADAARRANCPFVVHRYGKRKSKSKNFIRRLTQPGREVCNVCINIES
jgi:hypothetical protein